ncbi:MAG: hypothetical protein E3J86_07135 [Candidatus Thorarchaeota archaeon]|nr:MAG: hypothetical protein E3J86_07135 [Candidatus Thorarchaeota archaeon]
MNRLLEARRSVRRNVNSKAKYDRYIHLLVTLMLTTNMVLILYAMLSITLRMTLSGVGLVDTLPIALYILPLMIFLPLMIRAYYRERTAAMNFVFLLITSVFFGMLSSLLRGFIIFLFLNIIAIVSLFVMGRFRPKGGLRKVGKKGFAYFLLLNMLSLTFPVSVVLMGQNPIATTTGVVIPEIALTIPLSDFDFPYQNVTPTSGLLTEILDNAFYLDFKVLEDDSSSWSNLRTWLVAINDTEIEYIVTLVSNRGSLVGENPETLATTELIVDIYESHSTALTNLLDLSLLNISNNPNAVLFDMTLSIQEWQALMTVTRSLNLVGFGNLMRTSIYSTQLDTITNASLSLYDQAQLSGLDAGLVIESFVIDDMQDRDSGAMRLCGVSTTSLSQWDRIIISCERSRFSFEMSGDVGEYLVHSFSSSIGGLGSLWGMRIGEVGNSTDVLGRTDDVYDTLDIFVNDIELAVGNGISEITIGSLPSLLSAFGNNAIAELKTALYATTQGVATYTFRIYAFRAVFIAIDAFDFLML